MKDHLNERRQKILMWHIGLWVERKIESIICFKSATKTIGGQNDNKMVRWKKEKLKDQHLHVRS